MLKSLFLHALPERPDGDELAPPVAKAPHRKPVAGHMVDRVLPVAQAEIAGGVEGDINSPAGLAAWPVVGE